MKVCVAWDHSSLKNVDLVANQSFDLQAWILCSLIFGQSMIFSSEIFGRLSKLALKNITINLFNGHQ